MSELDFEIGVAFGAQSAYGTANSTIVALSGSLDSADGIVLGDAQSGIGGSGIDFSLIRGLREKAVVSGSFTRPASDFLGEKIQGFQMSFPLKGNGATTTTPVDSEYTPLAGIEAQIEACGLAGAAWGSGDGWEYVPASATWATAKIFWGDHFWTIRDLIGNLDIKWTPGDIAIATISYEGVVNSFGDLSFPTFSYGTQSSLSAPKLSSTGHNWGISAAVRGFSDATTRFDNQVTEIQDSESSDGIRRTASGREISHSATVWLDSADSDFERAELVRTTTPTEELEFTLGTPAGASETVNAVQLSLPTPELRSLKPVKAGTTAQFALELAAVAESANAEASLRFV